MDTPPSSNTSASLGKTTFDLYAEITRQITDMLDKGVIPWRSNILGQTRTGNPKNLNTGKAYRGVNVFLLAFTAFAKGYQSNFWLSYRQALGRGGNVKKGEKASMVVFWKPLEATDAATGQVTKRFMLRYYNVFNCEQCEKIDRPDAAAFTPSTVKPLEQAKAIVDGYADAPKIEHQGSRAYYSIPADTVTIPEPSRFTSTEEYYSTLFHELSHSTGAKRRLNRKMASDPKPYGTPDYGKEELIAEMAAAFLSAEANIQPVVIENQAAYIKGWLGQLKQDKRLVIQAAGAAQRAAEWIRGQRQVPTEEPREPEAVA